MFGDDARYEFGPVWSPDGTHIAYSSASTGPFADIFIARADGANEQQMTETPQNEIAVEWGRGREWVLGVGGADARSESAHRAIWRVQATGRRPAASSRHIVDQSAARPTISVISLEPATSRIWVAVARRHASTPHGAFSAVAPSCSLGHARRNPPSVGAIRMDAGDPLSSRVTSTSALDETFFRSGQDLRQRRHVSGIGHVVARLSQSHDLSDDLAPLHNGQSPECRISAVRRRMYRYPLGSSAVLRLGVEAARRVEVVRGVGAESGDGVGGAARGATSARKSLGRAASV